MYDYHDNHYFQIPPRFGLIDSSNDRWPKFEAKIRQLNQDSPIGTTYKHFLLTRHGQGYRTDSMMHYKKPNQITKLLHR